MPESLPEAVAPEMSVETFLRTSQARGRHEGWGRKRGGIRSRGTARAKAWDLGKASVWEEPRFRMAAAEGVKGKDGFRPRRPQAPSFSVAPPPHHIVHMKIHPHFVLNMSNI